MVHAAWAHRRIGQMVLHGRGASQDMVTVFNFEDDSVEEAVIASDADAQAAFDTIVGDWRTNVMSSWLACMASDYTLPRITMQVLEANGSVDHRLVPTEHNYTTSITGTYSATGATNTTTTCGIIRWKTPLAGKSHRGRTYVPFPGTTAAGQLASAAQTAYATFADAMLARYAAGGGGTFPHFSLTIYSRPYNDHLIYKKVLGVKSVVSSGDYAGNSTNVTARYVDATLRVQRRRELGVGS